MGEFILKKSPQEGDLQVLLDRIVFESKLKVISVGVRIWVVSIHGKCYWSHFKCHIDPPGFTIHEVSYLNLCMSVRMYNHLMSFFFIYFDFFTLTPTRGRVTSDKSITARVIQMQSFTA